MLFFKETRTTIDEVIENIPDPIIVLTQHGYELFVSIIIQPSGKEKKYSGTITKINASKNKCKNLHIGDKIDFKEENVCHIIHPKDLE